MGGGGAVIPIPSPSPAPPLNPPREYALLFLKSSEKVGAVSCLALARAEGLR